MAKTLNRTGEQKPEVDKGHGTGALGPSDTSDSGSDVRGGPGINEELRKGGAPGLSRGSTSDPDLDDSGTPTAGPDVGDANLDSDSDAGGTGERATAGRDTPGRPDRDRDTDRIESIDEIGAGEGTPEEGGPASDPAGARGRLRGQEGGLTGPGPAQTGRRRSGR